MAETPSTFMLKPGDPAPSFELPDPQGKRHAWNEVAGPRGTLVVFACNHCPYVILIADTLGKLAAEWKTKGLGVVAISSNDIENYPQDAPAHMAAFAAEHGWGFPYLHDDSQDVAKAFGAACTPDFFLFDGNGELFYAGQFDDSRPRNGTQPDGGDLASAVEVMLAGSPAPAEVRPSTGCNIKWKPGNEPAYFG
ncbi:thioredoxin family protein [Haloferula sargassicola]|uniref:Thioredoxin domain-containing protein n=1 Tax=Haloferula sargassicola TaxID=490096 RepID=A0ABP9UPU2_9BACT